jgi:hypothetical protein
VLIWLLDTADKDYYVICINDAGTTHTQQRHDNALNTFKGYCTTINTEQFIKLVKECNISSNNQDEHCINKTNNLVEPMSLTIFVTADLMGITRGHSIPTSDIIADSNPLVYVHGDVIETNGDKWGCCPQTLLKRN